MKTNLQGTTWFECREISKEEPLRRCMFLLIMWSVCYLIYYKSLGA